jgi:hypothetical protein
MQTMKIVTRIAVALIGLLAFSGLAHAQWTKIGSGNGNPGTAPGNGPSSVVTCLLLTDGSVMCQEYQNNHWWRYAPDNFGHYETGTWSKLQDSSSGYGPLFYCSAVMADGRVVVIGGEYNPLGTGESTLGYIFDPTKNSGAGQWSSSPISLGTTGWTKIGDSICSVLSDGTLIIGDGDNAPSANTTQIASLNLATQTLSLVNSPTLEGTKADGNGEEGWTLLPDGTILTVDTGTQGGTGSEIFTPGPSQTTNSGVGVTYNTWVSAGSTQVTLPNNGGQPIGPEMGAQVLRPDGTVIAFGATSNTAVYDYAGTKKWTAGPVFPSSNTSADAPAALLPSGNVLVDASPFFTTPTSFYEFDGTLLNPVTAAPNAGSDIAYNTRMLLLPTGQVLFTDSTGDVEVYTPGGTFQDSWRPTISGAPNSIDPANTYGISGTQFNGLSQASAYGDDATNATNYPLVRITNESTGHVFYARTHDHSSMGVATGSAPVSTNFDTPNDPEISGLCKLEVVANGIPSKLWVVNGPGLSIPGPLSLTTCQGSSTTTTLNICNTGKQDLTINSITSSDPQFSLSNPGYSLTVSPDFCFPFQVKYTPSGTGTTNGTLTVNSNDPNSPSTPVQITGSSPAPSINATIVNSGNFGNVCPAGQSNLALQITNQSQCNLVVSGISSSNPGLFLPPTLASSPLTLTADATVDLPISFQPGAAQLCSDTNPLTGTISISSNDPTTPTLITGVKGTVPCPHINSTFANSGSYGNVCAGTHSDMNLQLLNTGMCNLNISSITSSNTTGFILPVGTTFPLVLSADANVNVPVRFMPTGTCSNTTPQASTLTVNSNDPGGALTQAVSGIEGCPKLVLSPTNLSGAFAFPATVSDPTGTLGCYTDRQITVSNAGICPLNITSLTTTNALDGIGAPLASTPLEFNVVNPTVPVTIAPGAAPVPITVRFRPLILKDQNANAPDQQTGILNIVSNDPTPADNTTGLCGEPAYHSGARILVVDSTSNPVNSVKSLSLNSNGLTPVFKQTLSPAPLAAVSVCGNPPTRFQLDNENLRPAGTTGNSPRASYSLSAKQNSTQANMSFTLGQCEVKQIILQIR